MLRQGFPIHGAAAWPFARPPAPPGPGRAGNSAQPIMIIQ
ncbi:hypothetical protein L529_2741 [Bordetella bronchiseptica MBORD901]|nr:hypothetical protein L492_2776 [Bordetella bronchiseptica 7E71]KDD43959.1 hypothetical protein L529_2741 [Bordetella bronchiseptica MBORD901]